MSYIRKFQSFSDKKRGSEGKTVHNESVMIVNDMYKVNVTVDIPQSLINSYVKKVKDSIDKNARQFYSDQLVAEELVKYVLQQNLDINKIDARALFGGVPQGQEQAQGQVQVQAQTQAQPQGQAQAPAQGQAQPAQGEAQPQGQGQPQGQAQAPAQGEAQPQGQPQPQGQAQAPAQGQSQSSEEFEEVEEEEKEEEGEEELPI
jgi:hypothetical protein